MGGELGTVLNDEVPQYKGKAGGFYLFVTRNRPLIYFAPKLRGSRAHGSVAYYCEWRQDGQVVDFANPLGGPVTETLVPIPCTTPAEVFIKRHAALQRMSSQLCSGYSYHAMPTSAWTPPQCRTVLVEPPALPRPPGEPPHTDTLRVDVPGRMQDACSTACLIFCHTRLKRAFFKRLPATVCRRRGCITGSSSMRFICKSVKALKQADDSGDKIATVSSSQKAIRSSSLSA